MRALFLACKQPSSHWVLTWPFPQCSPMVRRYFCLFSSFYKATHFIKLGSHTYDLIQPELFPKYHQILGVRLLTQKCGDGMGDTIQSIARRQCKKTENRHFDLPASSLWKGLPGKKSTYQMRERAHTQLPLSQSAFPKFHPPPLTLPCCHL